MLKREAPVSTPAEAPSSVLRTGEAPLTRPRRRLKRKQSLGDENSIPMDATAAKLAAQAVEAIRAIDWGSRLFPQRPVLGDVTNLIATPAPSEPKPSSSGKKTAKWRRGALREPPAGSPPRKAARLERQRLPPVVVLRILDFAGAGRDVESEYAMDLLRRDRAAERRLFCHVAWHCAVPGQLDAVRHTLVRWLCEVRASYRLSRRTVLLAVSMLDRYLARRPTPKSRLQLVGACALFIASKVEELEALSLGSIVELCAGDHTDEDVKLCEHAILNALDFAVEGPTLMEFLPILISACQAMSLLGGDGVPAQSLLQHGGDPSPAERRRNETAWSLAERALLDADVSRSFPPSQVAAAALLLSNRLHGCRRPWSRSLVELSGYDAFALSTCVRALELLWRGHSYISAPTLNTSRQRLR